MSTTCKHGVRLPHACHECAEDIPTCKCGAPLIDSDDGICEKCFIHQVYEMDNPGPRWQTLAEAVPKNGELVCVEREDGSRIAASYEHGDMRYWQAAGSLTWDRFCNDTDRWHPWPGEGKK